MKEIIKVTCDDKQFEISIDGENIDLYTAIADIVKEISRQRNISTDTSIRIINKMLGDD